MFNEVIGMKEIDKTKRLNVREAVRAIIIQDSSILLVNTNRGDYIFPGGGVEGNETHEESLAREVEEETGYVKGEMGKKAGLVVERFEDQYDEGAIFEMRSHFYVCAITGEKTNQQLEGYEHAEEYTPKWVSLREAIEGNELAVKKYADRKWLLRENFVLKELLYKRLFVS